MRNWSTDTTELKKNPEKWAVWELEQLVNFGLQGKRLDAKLLERHLSKLQIDPHRKDYLNFLLHEAR